MIKLCTPTEWRNLSDDSKIFPIDGFFYYLQEKLPWNDVVELAQSVDTVRLIDENHLESKWVPGFPIEVTQLSTGCKTAILCRYFVQQSLSVTIDFRECGGNALRECFKSIDDTGVTGYLSSYTGFSPKVVNEFIFRLGSEVVQGQNIIFALTELED